MLRGFWRGASLAVLAGLALSLVACSQFAKLQAISKYKEANAQYRLQEYKKAAKLYEESVAADPENSVAYFYLANSYDNMYKPSRKGEKENDEYLTKAIENYKLASEKGSDPKQRKLALEFLVNAYGTEKMNDPSQALPIVEKMIQIDPQDTSSYFILAKIHEDAGEYDKAEATMLKAKEARPNDPVVYLQLAGFYNRQEEFDKTIEAYNQRAALEPNNPESFYTIGAFYWDKAFRDFRLKEAEKKDFVMKGLAMMDKAIAIKADYIEALTMKNILLRLQANTEKDLAKQSALLKEADRLQAQANELRKQKVSGVTK
jgi:tetratricopeptide (TPR) repeat protein